MKKSDGLSLLLLSGFVLLVLVRCIYLLELDEVPFYQDFAGHAQSIVHFSDDIAQLRVDHLAGLADHGDIYPPLYHLVMATELWLFSIPIRYLGLGNIVFFVILIFSVYLFMRRVMAASALESLLTAILTGLSPGLQAYLALPAIEIALSAAVMLFFSILLARDGMQRNGPGVLFTLTIIAGLLIKQSFIVYIFFPCALWLIRAFTLRSPKEALKFAATLLVCLGGICCGVMFWYLPKFTEWMTIFVSNQSFRDNSFFLGNIAKNGYYLFHYGLGPVLFIVTLAILPFFLLRPTCHRLFLMLWLVPPLLIFPSIHPPTIRYFLPIYPVWAIVVVSGCLSLARKFGHPRLAMVIPGSLAVILLIDLALKTFYPQDGFDEDILRRRLHNIGIDRPLGAGGDFQRLVSSGTDIINDRLVSGSTVSLVLLVESNLACALGFALWSVDPARVLQRVFPRTLMELDRRYPRQANNEITRFDLAKADLVIAAPCASQPLYDYQSSSEVQKRLIDEMTELWVEERSRMTLIGTVKNPIQDSIDCTTLGLYRR